MPPPPPPPLAQEVPRPAAAAAGEDHGTMDEARPAAKCEICGSGENQQVMFSCIQCNGRQHRYCLVVVEFEMRYDWCCSECQKKANGDPKPIQGEKTEFQRLDKSQRNVAHQIGVKTPQIYENSKVKFIPREEAALLSRERPAVHYTRRFVTRRTRSQVNPASPPNLKCSSPSRQVHPASPPRMKCISPSRQVHPASPPNLKCSSPSRQVHPASPPRMKCISPSRQVHPASPTMKCISPSRQVDPAAPSSMKPSSSMKNILPSRQGSPPSPRSMKQSCSKKCVSPSRSDGQAFSLKRCAVASQNPIKADDTKKRQKVQSGATIPMIPHNTKGEVTQIDQQLQDQPKEEKVANADIGKCNSWVDDQLTGKSALNASVLTDADSGCGSGTKSLHNNIDMPVIISSSPEYARRPPPKACWTGCFLLSEGESSNLGEFKAYFPSVVSSRVCNIVKKKMPNNIQLKISPRMNYWPKTFDEFCPVYEDIALIFFSAELDCYNKKHPRRLEAYSNFVMKAYIDDIMLLIYSSEVLPPDSQWIDGESYLWGVFVKPKAKSNHAHLGSGST